MDFISKNEAETEEFARLVSSQIKAGDVLALFGELGAGKTTFTKALAKFLGVNATITSPTFVILKNYKINQPVSDNLKEAKELIHVDCYRFDSENDAFSVGLDEYFERKDTIMIIEWPEKIESLLPKKAKKIIFSYLGENERKIEATWIKK